VGHRFLELTTTPAVQAARLRWEGADRYAGAADGPDHHDRLGVAEAGFVSARDGFYLGSVNEAGWPYVQFRGGPKGFLRVLDDRTLGFADFRGNRQHLTAGNVSRDDRVALFLMDYAQQRRLKLLGRLTFSDDPGLLSRVTLPGYPAKVERAARIDVVAFDWNCPQHIPIRFGEAEIAAAAAPLHRRIAELEAENDLLRRRAGPGAAG
jgi:uncharacterized protein